VVGAVPELGHLGGVRIADEIAEGSAAAEDVVDTGAEDAGGLQAEEGGEAGDEVGEQAVEEESGDQGPFEESVDEDDGDFGSFVSVQHGGKLVGSHSFVCF